MLAERSINVYYSLGASGFITVSRFVTQGDTFIQSPFMRTRLDSQLPYYFDLNFTHTSTTHFVGASLDVTYNRYIPATNTTAALMIEILLAGANCV